MKGRFVPPWTVHSAHHLRHKHGVKCIWKDLITPTVLCRKIALIVRKNCQNEMLMQCVQKTHRLWLEKTVKWIQSLHWRSLMSGFSPRKVSQMTGEFINSGKIQILSFIYKACTKRMPKIYVKESRRKLQCRAGLNSAGCNEGAGREPVGLGLTIEFRSDQMCAYVLAYIEDCARACTRVGSSFRGRTRGRYGF